MTLGGPAFTVLVALLATGGLARAQGAVPVDSGTVVRLHLSDGGTRRGRLLSLVAPPAVTVAYCRYPGPPCRTRTDLGVDSVLVSRVIHLDAAAGSHWQRGAILGGVVGAVLGVAAIAFAEGMCETSDCVNGAWGGAAVVFALGTGLGLAFGSTSLTWRAVW